ncbi:hypothetical protein [Brucella thiophenivorans]|uniref:Uncharacterized protein n=1 Tax=Brucella thiophenivorans TaxID=571255 RepID=A0A256FVP2_9HYPH|nr:hypothetical protein [Brucella thiophenivorans]OYR18919.1 hypothetical protein CEV31_2259 [Brucella thiophenivorans]
MLDEPKFKTEVECGGFHLPAAYTSHVRQLNQKVAMASLIASVSIASILGAQILWG